MIQAQISVTIPSNPGRFHHRRICQGIDTASTTLEWAMTELLRNPGKMAKAQAELDEILGKDGGLVQESDIERLPYLQAVVKETLSLHPPALFLIPRKAENDVNFYGYVIPCGSQLVVNLCAISQDPSTWQNPTVFLPERFMESQIDFRGQHFELIPFGAGRRICSGIPLAYRMLSQFENRKNWNLEKREKRH